MNTAFAEEAKVALEKTTEEERRLMRERGKKLYLGHEKRAGWSGELPFYLFRCEACGEHAKDYPHGFIERQYLLCSHCRARHSFVPWYAGFVVFWQNLRNKFGDRPSL